MTVQPTRDQLRALAQDHAYIPPDAILALLDQLAAVEAERNLLRDQLRHMIDSWHSLDEQVARANAAEARIKAVRDALDAVDGDYDSHGAHRLGVTRRIRRALDS